MNNKYQIGQSVFVYDSGWLLKKEIKEIITVSNHNETIVSYKFKEKTFDEVWFMDNGIHEGQVFLSKEDFISNIKYDE